MSTFASRLHSAISSKKTPALVGLDPRWQQLPKEIQVNAQGVAGGDQLVHAKAYEEFCKRIIDVVAPLVPAVKPQAAFFEQCGPAGVIALANVIHYARRAGLIVICDAKRGDIGTTAEAYAAAYLAGANHDSAPFGADALTVNPYMGVDTLQPFVDRANAVGGGIYVLVRTSNPGARDFQDRRTDGQTLYQAVAAQVERLAAESADATGYGAVGAVVGATYPEELKELREIMSHTQLLIPGYGSQGGSSADTSPGFAADGHGALINSSRNIIFSYRLEQYSEEFGETRWEDAVHKATLDMIEDLAQHTPASALK